MSGTINASRRQAIALVEVVSVIGVVGILLFLSAGLLHQAYRAHHRSIAHLQEVTQQQRLAEQLRRDVHAADVIRVQRSELQMEMNEQLVTIHQVENRAVRTMASKDGQIQQQAAWSLQPGSQLAFRVEMGQDRPLIQAVVLPAPGSARSQIQWVATTLAKVIENKNE